MSDLLPEFFPTHQVTSIDGSLEAKKTSDFSKLVHVKNLYLILVTQNLDKRLSRSKLVYEEYFYYSLITQNLEQQLSQGGVMLYAE